MVSSHEGAWDARGAMPGGRVRPCRGARDTFGRMPRPAGPPSPFSTADLGRDLARRSTRSGAAVLVGQGLTTVITLGATAVLARLLTPVDYGLVGMVAAVTAFIVCFRDLGLTQATVQRDDITHEQVSNLFWINAVVGLVGAGLAAVLAYPIAWFYGEPELVPITLALALAFPLTAVGAQHRAILQRRMRFRALAVVRVLATLVGFAVAVVVALATANYWALVAAELVTAAMLSAGPWLASGWTPGLPKRRVSVRSLVRFGAFLALTNLLGAAQRNVDKVVVGRAFGDAALGAYSRAYAILFLPITQLTQPLTQVALPTLARMQDEPERFRAFYRRGLSTVALLAVPGAAFTFVAADPIVRALLGSQWGLATPIVRALAPALMVGSLNVATAWPYLALGRTDRQFRWLCIATAVYVPAFIVAAQLSAVAVAGAVSAVLVGLRLPAVAYCFRGTPLGVVADFIAPVWRPVAAAVAAAALLEFAAASERGRAAAEGLVAPVEIVVLAVAFGGLYAACLAIAPGGVRQLRDAAALVRHFKRSRGVQQEAASPDADGV